MCGFLALFTENDGLFNWLVPDTISSQCLFKISDVSGDIYDTSDSVFAIIGTSFERDVQLVPGLNILTVTTVDDMDYTQAAFARHGVEFSNRQEFRGNQVAFVSRKDACGISLEFIQPAKEGAPSDT